MKSDIDGVFKMLHDYSDFRIWWHSPKPAFDLCVRFVLGAFAVVFVTRMIRRNHSSGQYTLWETIGLLSFCATILGVISYLENTIHDGYVVQGPHAWYARAYTHGDHDDSTDEIITGDPYMTKQACERKIALFRKTLDGKKMLQDSEVYCSLMNPDHAKQEFTEESEASS